MQHDKHLTMDSDLHSVPGDEIEGTLNERTILFDFPSRHFDDGKYWFWVRPDGSVTIEYHSRHSSHVVKPVGDPPDTP